MRHAHSRLFLLSLFIIPAACTGGDAPVPDDAPVAGAANVVEVVATGLAFEAPDSIPSGWTTFRLLNESPLTHFVLIDLLPEGKTFADSENEVIPVFQDGMDLLNEGRTSEGFVEFERLPAWYADITFNGGPGLLAPGKTGETTVYLVPGTYVLECYVKTAGRFHSADGMARQLVVTGEPSNAPEPTGTLALSVSANGIVMQELPAAGMHTVKVEFVDQMVHKNFLGHDVHLVRLENDTNLAELAAWMDWVNVNGLATPAPAEFLGGTHEMPAGSVAYFTVDLSPGNYAWIAEVPDPLEKGMLVTFTVE